MNRLPVFVRQHIAGLRALLVFTVLLGLIYPAVMTGVSQLAFHNHANGSLVSYNGKTVGSSLLCQEFADAKGNPLPQYFQPRPSNATSGAKNDYGCDPLYSAASNLGPNNPVLLNLIRTRQKQVAAFDKVKDSMKSILRHDGDDVSMEKQVNEMMKNQQQHNLAINIMSAQFRLLRAAITERVA